MTDKEIAKIAEHCAHWKCFEDCEKCYAFKIYQHDCGFHMTALYLDLINRQKAEIERLKAKSKQKNPYEEYGNCVAIGDSLIFTHTLNDYDKLIKDIETEAIKEFAKLIIDKSRNGVIRAADIPDLVKEMTEVQE